MDKLVIENITKLEELTTAYLSLINNEEYVNKQYIKPLKHFYTKLNACETSTLKELKIQIDTRNLIS